MQNLVLRQLNEQQAEEIRNMERNNVEIINQFQSSIKSL